MVHYDIRAMFTVFIASLLHVLLSLLGLTDLCWLSLQPVSVCVNQRCRVRAAHTHTLQHTFPLVTMYCIVVYNGHWANVAGDTVRNEAENGWLPLSVMLATAFFLRLLVRIIVIDDGSVDYKR